MDLLLQLLTNMVYLPVGKTHVKKSGMGKLIGSIEKHAMVKGTPNEAAVSDRVQKVKDAWQASVKARKARDAAAAEATKKSEEAAKAAAAAAIPKKSGEVASKKREANSTSSPTSAKRTKTVDSGKSSSLSSLLGRVSGTSSSGTKAEADASETTASAKKSAAEKKSQTTGKIMIVGQSCLLLQRSEAHYLFLCR